MSRPGPLVAALVVLALLASVAGCVEVKDPPETGDFTIEVELEPLHFVSTTGGTIEEPHPEVETDLHHDHPNETWWELGSIGRFDEGDLEVPAMAEGLTWGSYHMVYYEQEDHLPFLVAVLGEANGTYLLVGDATTVHGDPEPPATSVLNITAVSGTGDEVMGDAGALFRPEGNFTEPIVVNVTLPADGGTATYLLGLQMGSGLMVWRWHHATHIEPGETHQVRFGPGTEKNVTIFGGDDPLAPAFEGNFTQLPNRYAAHLGELVWEGSVGEEEAPGLTSWTAVLAIAVVALVARRRR